MNPLLKKSLALCAEMESLGGEALVAGGAVRDYLLGIPLHDADIAHGLPIDTVKNVFNPTFVGQGEKFGVALIRYDGETFEATCFRNDGTYGDGRRPDGVSPAKNFIEDSKRRDFTINAMGLKPNLELVDHWGGANDIDAKLIRCVGDPSERIIEDPVRMLRAARFAACLGFTIEDETAAAIKKNAHNLSSVARERVSQEMIKAAHSPKSLASFIEISEDLGVLEHFLPEISRMKNFRHNPAHHPEGNVFQHTLAALRVAETTSVDQNLAILFHDIGKPITHATGRHGHPTYYGHEEAGAKLLPSVCSRLRMTNDSISCITAVAAEHGKAHRLSEMRPETQYRLWTHPHYDSIKVASMADNRCRLHVHDEAAMQDNIAAFEQRMASYGDKDAVSVRLSELARGEIIMEALPGLQSSKIGLYKKQTTDWILSKGLDVTPVQVNEFLLGLPAREAAGEFSR